MHPAAAVSAISFVGIPVLTEQRVNHVVELLVVENIDILASFQLQYLVLIIAGNLIALVGFLPLISRIPIILVSSGIRKGGKHLMFP